MSAQTVCNDGKEWSPVYLDPRADLILVSNDKVCYRVHSHIMSLKSGLVRDMLSLPLDGQSKNAKKRSLEIDDCSPSTSVETAQDEAGGETVQDHVSTIDVDASAIVLEIYLLLLYTPDWLLRAPFTRAIGLRFEELVELQRLCDMLQTSAWNHTITTVLRQQAHADPWAAFCHAARTNDVELARQAIRAFGNQTNPATEYPDIPTLDFDKLNALWCFELFRLMFKHKRPATYHSTDSALWEKVADEFQQQ
ncbi:hypothetical protein BD324DRAFT_130486 [Kockovaella imperatae]|uniref:BTB domain-containing protein n=1 Tax=Kockovaella imperatae TaxID=4999 RepID=A0A1Y1UB40_9TREE|nr:hypothetical protein BD324DRAFT_130486 [Kockovaella imperatae]ORX34737.1 hypothetical protein BD324DRAFT_130486 [Kockovaella imperatae]